MRDFSNVLFDALGNKSRFKILSALTEKPLSVSELSKKTGIEQTNISHNLNTLLKCKIVIYKNSGKRHIYTINYEFKSFIKIVIKDIKKHQSILKKGGLFVSIMLFVIKPLATYEVGQTTLIFINMLQPIKDLIFAG
ncbi:MAG: metalloregulator ArsR/SmtB family transcription factor [Candidatus Marsarchaeota archaeon]|nr:metalloregulator ArsR/SmtB family transcription factor [Candidatus Marsarchaeota archaeon]